MKKNLLSTAFITILLPLALFAGGHLSTLHVSSEKGNDLEIWVDNVQQCFKKPNHTIHNLREGYHFVEIYSFPNYWGGWFQHNQFNSSRKLIFSGQVHIDRLSDVYASVHPYRGFRVTNVIARLPVPPNCGHHGCKPGACHKGNHQGWGNGNWNGHAYKVKKAKCGHTSYGCTYGTCHKPKGPKCGHTGYGCSFSTCHKPQKPNCGHTGYGCSHSSCHVRSMSDHDFNAFIRSMDNAYFESSRLSTAKMVIGKNFINTRQLAAIISTFNFESSRLEVAKFAYNKTIDRNNYFKIYDEFYFSSSIDDLNQFIAMR